MNRFAFEPWVWYGLLALGLCLTALIFAALQVQIRRLRRARRDDQERTGTLEGALAEARLALERLEADLREIEQQTGMLVAPAPPGSGLNLSKRTQVLRMHRSGQDGTAIATALGLPRAEVELLIKVQGVILEHMAPVAT